MQPTLTACQALYSTGKPDYAAGAGPLCPRLTSKGTCIEDGAAGDGDKDSRGDGRAGLAKGRGEAVADGPHIGRVHLASHQPGGAVGAKLVPEGAEEVKELHTKKSSPMKIPKLNLEELSALGAEHGRAQAVGGGGILSRPPGAQS
jgi:hypothetical protein